MAVTDRVHIEVKDTQVVLPFAEEAQQALLGHIMQHTGFFKQTYKKIEPEWFVDSHLTKIYATFVKFYETLNRSPLGIQEFLEWREFNAFDQATRLKLQTKVRLCHTRTQLHGMDWLADQLNDWAKSQTMLARLPQVANLINSHQIQAAEQVLHGVSHDLIHSRFNANPIVDWTDYKNVFNAMDLEMDRAISTGLSILDRKLLPESNGGSLLPGDTTIILAPTNSGKTSVMVTCARHNVFANKSILFITREGREYDIMTKFYQSIFKKTRQELRVWSRTEEGGHAMDVLTKHMNRYLHYLHLPKVTAYVEDTVADIQRMQAIRRAETGQGYDLLAVDYPGIFQMRESKGAKWEFRQVQDAVYRQFVQLAGEEKFHAMLAAQTNREGSKVNSGLSAKRLLRFEDVAEAFGIAQSATNVITLNRDENAQASNFITFNLVKSRSSETGWAISARSDYSRCITHSDELGATAYRANVNISGQIESLLRNYTNRDVPEGIIDGYHVNEENK